jgi:hypothetical protein
MEAVIPDYLCSHDFSTIQRRLSDVRIPNSAHLSQMAQSEQAQGFLRNHDG